MNEKSEKPRLSHTIVRTEVSYLDMQGNFVTPDKAVRVITRKYDKDGKLIASNMTFDPGKAQKIE